MFFSGAFFSAGNWYRLCASLKKSRQWLCSEITSLLIPVPVGHTINLQELLLSFDASSSFFFITREPTTWPAYTCLQIMVCSSAMSSNCVSLQIIFCSYVKSSALFSFLRSLLRENGKMADIHYWTRLSQNIVIFQCLLVDQLWSARHWQITIFCSTSSNNCRPIIVFTIKVLVEPSDDIIYWA